MSDENAATPTTTNGWGVACAKCGHPATYHGMTFCTVHAGGDYDRASRPVCDCDGYNPWKPS